MFYFGVHDKMHIPYNELGRLLLCIIYHYPLLIDPMLFTISLVFEFVYPIPFFRDNVCLLKSLIHEMLIIETGSAALISSAEKLR